MTTAFNRICRICSSPADYEIFAKIPTYLHATSNEFLNWQRPINVLLEETTGLKITPDEPLPRTICAICISYLKHAVTFREQTINNTLALMAVRQLCEQQQPKQSNVIVKAEDKASQLITAQDLLYSDERILGSLLGDSNLLMNNSQHQEQDKVRKQLLQNNLQADGGNIQLPTQQNVEQQMRYLNLLFNKDTNSGLTPKRRNAVDDGSMPSAGSGGDGDEDFPTTTSSDENDDGDASGSKGKYSNIFSYQEKNFEEDDIMDLDELRNAIIVNKAPESCKERKCRACWRRFMFEDSYREHTDTCIEYTFLSLIEEVNRLLDIRRNKAVSPHEFIRRMIFALRKTCDWLKANCGDMLLPDLSCGDALQKQRLESGGKPSTTSSDEQPRQQPALLEVQATKLTANERLTKLVDGQQKRNKTFFVAPSGNANKRLASLSGALNAAAKAKDTVSQLDEHSIRELFATPKAPSSLSERGACVTPISMSNNILYEIERSQSRNSSKETNNHLDFSMPPPLQLQKPIAVLATNSTITTTTTTTTATFNRAIVNEPDALKAQMGGQPDEARLTFLQKLQQAACPTPTTTPLKPPSAAPQTPLIQVRKDLLPASRPMAITPPIIPPVIPKTPPSIFSARCNPCQLLFETLAALEMHNAMQHNNNTISSRNSADLEAERKRIIALFEEEDDV